MTKEPHELWKEAGGDLKRYRELLIEHGLMIKADHQPEPHPFRGMTKLCHCHVCQGRFDAPWHVGDAIFE